MKARELPYCLLPGPHRARAYIPSDRTNLAERFREIREQHFASDDDDHAAAERTAYLAAIKGVAK